MIKVKVFDKFFTDTIYLPIFEEPSVFSVNPFSD